MIKKIMLVAGVCSMVSLSGCATIFTGTQQDITVKAVNAKTSKQIDAACHVVPTEGSPKSVNTPGSITVDKSQGTLEMTCNKDSYVTKKEVVEQKFNPVTLINILFWPGFIVDAISHTMSKYPSDVTVNMEPKA